MKKILYILYINKKKEEENISRYMYSKKNNKGKKISGLNEFDLNYRLIYQNNI